MALVAVVALVGVAYLLIVIRKDRSEGEVVLQSVLSEGPFPWTTSVIATDLPSSVPLPATQERNPARHSAYQA